jgi:hypothetical protein
MDISREDIDPFIDIPATMSDRVDAWLTAISAILTNRFSAKPTPDPDPVPAASAPAIFDIVARAIGQRLADERAGSGRDPRVKAQAVAGSSAQYFDTAQSTSWFNAYDLKDLAELFDNAGSVRSVRTPAPDAIRYGNLTRHDEWLDEPVVPIEAAI